MYLKSIEIQGFKSFANKIKFEFHNGITGIVGPNGSGKSNVADAVRWVFGEQKVKQLRGSSMQDVIFSGTETRKPLSYAYVAITLDNADHQLAIDYSEVTVARRIYRSGESEYLINGAQVRLRDVNELFYDTGIGKEGYSIIGQGQIDKILSGKPEERRELFDEAAGIVKFKRRKAQAEGKLESERQNLTRVDDILSEMEHQLTPLKAQAETAKAYLKKREELRTLDVRVFLLENDRLQKKLKSVEEKYLLAREELSGTSEENNTCRAEYEKLQEESKLLEETLEGARSCATQQGLAKEKLEGQIGVLGEQINSLRSNEALLLTRRERTRKSLEERRKERELLLKDQEEIDRQTAGITTSRDSHREALSRIQEAIAQLDSEIEESRNAIIEELNHRAQLKSRLGSFDTLAEQITIRRAELNARLLRAQTEEDARKERTRQLSETFQRLTDEIAALRRREGELNDKLADIRVTLGQKDASLRESQNGYHQERSKLEALSNLTERYEGYGGAVKKIMELKGQEKGIVGVVADIIQTDKAYETAIETALGGSIQNIVTVDEATAKRLIQYLKTNRLGRATFLPLNSLTKAQRLRNDKALAEPGVIGLADDLVRIQKSYQNVAKSLLGRILVVDTMDNAVRIAAKYDYSLRMVTLEGELLVPGGAISGGAFKNNSNLLGRRRELEELERQSASLAAKVRSLEEDIERTKVDRNRMRSELEECKEQIQQKSIELNTTRVNITQARERSEEEAQGFSSLNQELQSLTDQTEQMEKEKADASRSLSESEEWERLTVKTIGEKQEELEALEDNQRAAQEDVTEWERKAERVLQAQEFRQADANRLLREEDQLSGELQEIEDSIAGGKQQEKDRQEEIVALREDIKNAEAARDEAQKRLEEGLSAKEALTKRQDNILKKREELSAKESVLDKEVYRLGAQRDKLEESGDTLINYMWSEYEITLTDAFRLCADGLGRAGSGEDAVSSGADAASSDEDAASASLNRVSSDSDTAGRSPATSGTGILDALQKSGDVTGMKKQIASLKEQIRKMGTVNVNAVEDYRVLSERYQFMKIQHDDLAEAEKTLLNVIGELDSCMRAQFSEKFAEISKEFDKVFQELFGGGKGTLELMEDEDILEAGIRIIAQPPGKKLQNMMQLSGGEKALTAIALLFAIQNLKPSPFCLLDEIEAALDESNVGRFARYLHKLTLHTQFIVITHRRGTMEQVDRLYGITMQEKGVSTMVSVNLIDKDLED